MSFFWKIIIQVQIVHIGTNRHTLSVGRLFNQALFDPLANCQFVRLSEADLFTLTPWKQHSAHPSLTKQLHKISAAVHKIIYRLLNCHLALPPNLFVLAFHPTEGHHHTSRATAALQINHGPVQPAARRPAVPGRWTPRAGAQELRPAEGVDRVNGQRHL